MGMTRNQAITLLKQYIQDERMLNHSYASEAVMRALARRLGQDEEKWGLAGCCMIWTLNGSKEI